PLSTTLRGRLRRNGCRVGGIEQSVNAGDAPARGWRGLSMEVHTFIATRSRIRITAMSGYAQDPSTVLTAERTTVLALVVLAVIARTDRLPPPRAVAVPGDRLLQALGEAHLRLPAERAQLLGGERVAAVVARPVGDVLDQRLVVAGQLDDSLDDLDV